MEANTGSPNGGPGATSAKPDAVHVEHLCEHPGCTAWGSFGRPGQTGLTVWKCRAHDPVYGVSE